MPCQLSDRQRLRAHKLVRFKSWKCEEEFDLTIEDWMLNNSYHAQGIEIKLVPSSPFIPFRPLWKSG